MRSLARLLVVPGALLLCAAPAAAVPIAYSIVLTTDTAAPFASGTVVVDDAGFTPGGTVALSDLDIAITEGVDPDIHYQISDCSGTPQGHVDGSGADLAAVSAFCDGVEVAPGGDNTFELFSDGTYEWVVIEGFVGSTGTYALEFLGVPEPGLAVLLATALALAAAARRS